MIEMDALSATSFEIIAEVGDARSCYLEAIRSAKSGQYEKANELMECGRKSFCQGHAAHAELISDEASGRPVCMNLMMTHAEDQLMSAEAFGILAKEFIDLYKRLDQLESIYSLQKVG